MNNTTNAGRLAMSVLMLGQLGCMTVNTEITIAARPATVWQVVSDAAGYAEWNPVHVRVEGEFTEGGAVKVHLRSPDGKIQVVDSTVRRADPKRKLHQSGGVPLIFTFNHTFLLEPVPGGTRVTQREEFRGVGVPFVDMSWVEDGYRQVNEALKERAEALE